MRYYGHKTMFLEVSVSVFIPLDFRSGNFMTLSCKWDSEGSANF
jgi:hypothetical protein